MDQLRVGLVGGGPWARRVHGPALAAHPRVELAAVWTRHPDVARQLATELGGRAHADVDALFADADAVAFAVPPAVQAGLAVRAAAAGCHLICEKPLAGSVGDAEAVVAAVGQAGVHSSMMLTLRHDPAVRGWLAGLPSGTPGVDTVGSARWLSGSLLGGPYAGSSWRIEQGALLDIGPPVIDRHVSPGCPTSSSPRCGTTRRARPSTPATACTCNGSSTRCVGRPADTGRSVRDVGRVDARLRCGAVRT